LAHHSGAVVDSFYVAWRYLSYNWLRTATLVACVSIILALPLALNFLLDVGERQLTARAQATPLVVGAKGSALDLTLNALYFGEQTPELISMAEDEAIARSGLALPIPLYVRFQARNFPIVGTTLDYFELRRLTVADGRNLAFLGECVLGSAVAKRLGLAPGDSLLSSPESVFDLAGVYPLKMKVVGVLAPTHGPDDLAVFVDVKTAWVIQGLGHGHENLATVEDESVVLERSDSNVMANAKLLKYNEITPANLDSFHFHGDPALYPLTGVIVAPDDERAGTILRGRYLQDESRQQIVRPAEVIGGLLQSVFRIKDMMDAAMATVGAATVLALMLVFALSLRLREREMTTMFKLGCSRATMARFVAAEILIIGAFAAVLCAAVLALVNAYGVDLVRALILQQGG
jgi:putative ABC transport system permease protein